VRRAITFAASPGVSFLVGASLCLAACVADLPAPEQDLDGDGWSAADGDCADHDPGRNPGAEDWPDRCDGSLDNDCDGKPDGEQDGTGPAWSWAAADGTAEWQACEPTSIFEYEPLGEGSIAWTGRGNFCLERALDAECWRDYAFGVELTPAGSSYLGCEIGLRMSAGNSYFQPAWGDIHETYGYVFSFSMPRLGAAADAADGPDVRYQDAGNPGDDLEGPYQTLQETFGRPEPPWRFEVQVREVESGTEVSARFNDQIIPGLGGVHDYSERILSGGIRLFCYDEGSGEEPNHTAIHQAWVVAASTP
jgi:hypothetical protein